MASPFARKGVRERKEEVTYECVEIVPADGTSAAN
jgi:hypothetical protein